MKYRADIDGLRAIAVLFVFVYHLLPQTLPGGFLGVDVFFVISGFLITNIIKRQIEEERFSFLEFYGRRVKRIFPALFFLLFATSFLALLFLPSVDFAEFFRAARHAAGQISNYLFMSDTGYFEPDHSHSVLLHTWSLGVEEQFYLFWPFLIYWLQKVKNQKTRISILAGVCLVSLIACEIVLDHNPKFSFYMMPTRLWELGLGGLLAFSTYRVNQKLSLYLAALGLALIFLSSFIVDGATRFPGLTALPSVLGAMLVIFAGQGSKQSHLVQKALAAKPMVFVGQISYSLYLWHWPLIILLKKYYQEELSTQQNLIVIALAFLLATFSWRFIERPFRGKYLSQSLRQKWQVLGWGALVIALSIGFSNLLKTHAKSPWRYHEFPNTEPFKMHKDHQRCAYSNEIDQRGGPLPNAKECTRGKAGQSPEILLIGDSHASHFFPAFTKWAEDNKRSVRLAATTTCLSALGDYTLVQKNQPSDRCRNYSMRIKQLIAESPNVEWVVLAMRTAIYTGIADIRNTEERIYVNSSSNNERSIVNSKEHIEQLLRETIQFLSAQKKKVLLVKQVPILRKNPVDCIESSSLMISKVFPIENSHCFEFDAKLMGRRFHFEDELFNKLKNEFSVSVFDPRKHIPAAKVHDQIFYYDDDHLNKEGAEFLSQFISQFIKLNF